MRYNYSDVDGQRTLVLYFADGGIIPLDHSHPGFDAAMRAARDGDEDAARNAVNTEVAIGLQLRDKAPGFDVDDNGSVTYAGNPVSPQLSERILQLLREGNGSLDAFIKFAERLEANVSKHSRDQFFAWIDIHDLTIDADGYFIGYKGVRPDYRSISSGPGIVNGVPTNGHLDNSIGNVVEVERRYVDDNPNSACSTGLHAGTWAYASTFGTNVVTVRIDPADVVSVPHDCNAAKIRCSKYVVIDHTEGQSPYALWDGTQDYSGYYDDLDPSDYDEGFWDGEDESEADYERGYSDGERLARPLENQSEDYYEGWAEGSQSVLNNASR